MSWSSCSVESTLRLPGRLISVSLCSDGWSRATTGDTTISKSKAMEAGAAGMPVHEASLQSRRWTRRRATSGSAAARLSTTQSAGGRAHGCPAGRRLLRRGARERAAAPGLLLHSPDGSGDRMDDWRGTAATVCDEPARQMGSRSSAAAAERRRSAGGGAFLELARENSAGVIGVAMWIRALEVGAGSPRWRGCGRAGFAQNRQAAAKCRCSGQVEGSTRRRHWTARARLGGETSPSGARARGCNWRDHQRGDSGVMHRVRRPGREGAGMAGFTRSTRSPSPCGNWVRKIVCHEVLQ